MRCVFFIFFLAGTCEIVFRDVDAQTLRQTVACVYADDSCVNIIDNVNDVKVGSGSALSNLCIALIEILDHFLCLLMPWIALAAIFNKLFWRLLGRTK